MSSYIRNTKRLDTGEWEGAFWIDDYFAHHHYGVIFEDGTVVDPRAVELETNQEPHHLSWENYPPKSERKKAE